MKQDFDSRFIELIRSSLPEKEVGVVKKIFEEREELEKKNIELVKQNSDYIKRLEKLSEIARDYEININEINEKEQKLISKESEIYQREKILNETLLKKDIEMAKSEAKIITDCFNKVMSVPVIRKNVQSQVPLERTAYQQVYENGQYINKPSHSYVDSCNQESTETITQE